jgi:metal-responsive CopG/Arc/MetJ family transcriptional regulator
MIIALDNIGSRSSKKKTTFTIDEDLLINFKKIAKTNNKKLSPIIEDLLKLYIQQEQSLIK